MDLNWTSSNFYLGGVLGVVRGGGRRVVGRGVVLDW